MLIITYFLFHKTSKESTFLYINVRVGEKSKNSGDHLTFIYRTFIFISSYPRFGQKSPENQIIKKKF